MPAGGAKPKSKASGTEMIGKKEAVAEGEEDLYNGHRDHLEIDETGLYVSETGKKLLVSSDKVYDEINRYFSGRHFPLLPMQSIGRAVHDYTGPGDYKKVRDAAKKWFNTETHSKSGDGARGYEQFTKIESFIARAPKMPEGTVVYRGVGSKRVFDAIKNISTGGEYQMKSPTSTSTKRNVAEAFMAGNSTRTGDNYKVFMTIKGAAQKTGASIHTLSRSTDQFEVLLSGRTILRKVSERIEKKGKNHFMHVEFEYARSDSRYTELTYSPYF
jgi:hypothetical protein